MRVRENELESVLIDGKPQTRPKLDAHGQEIELYSVDIPADVEFEGPKAIDAYVQAKVAAMNAPSPAPAPTPVSPSEDLEE